MSGEGASATSRKSSRIQGFYRLDRSERLAAIDAASGASSAPLVEGPPFELMDTFVENAVGSFSLPLGVAVNFVVDGVDRLVPMAVEESSVIAAASNMARLCRESGGFQTEVVDDLMIGQVQIRNVADATRAEQRLRAEAASIVAEASALDPRLASLGGGCRSIDVRHFSAQETGEGPAVVVHLLVDCKDAMGANIVNTMCERLAPRLAALAEGQPGLRILSNFADRRIFVARTAVPMGALGTAELDGAEVAEGIAAAARFAWYDPYRAATHNKGIMNGIDPVVIATGNDWRAIEAGAHAYASRTGRYRALSQWTVRDGALHGELRLPLQLGTVGGVTRLHPQAKAALALLGTQGGQELGRVIAAVGLAQNLGALRALSTEGIQRGHMRLHERNLELARSMEGGA